MVGSPFMVKLRTNDRVSIPRAVENRRKKRRGERRKQLEKRRERKKTVVAPSQVTNLVKTRAAGRETFGVQWRIENGAQTSIVPATSGIVKYDRLLVKWDENIGCRLASVLPLAFPPPLPLRSCVVFHLCSSAGQCGTACHEMTMTIRLSCKSIFVSWSRSSFSPPLNFFGTRLSGGTYLYLLIGWYPPPLAPNSLSFRFHAPPRVFDFSVFLARSAISPIQRRNESYHVPVECPARSLLGFPACYGRDWNFFFPGNRFFRNLYPCTVIYLRRKILWNDKCIERKDGSVSIPIMKITWRVYGRSVARETEREIRSEASRWTHWKRIYLRGKLMVERRSDEWICLFSFFLLQISLH